MTDGMGVDRLVQNIDRRYEGKSIHLEITSKCQLACVVCPRTRFPDMVPKMDMDVDLVVSLATGHSEVYMCGDHGDPIYHADLHRMLGMLQERAPQAMIVLETNGSGRSREWWTETARHLRAKDVVKFNVDGVRSNNHIYRIGSRWDSIEIGMRTLREENPRVQIHWRYILMHHNQDTVEKAASLAMEIGLDRFSVIESSLYGEYEWTRPTRRFDDAVGAVQEILACQR